MCVSDDKNKRRDKKKYTHRTREEIIITMRRASRAFALFSKTASRDGFSSSFFPPPAEKTSSLFFAPPPRTTRNVSMTRRKEDEQNEDEETGTRRTETYCLCKEVKINAKIRKDQGHCVYKPVVVDDIVKSKKRKEGSLTKRAHWCGAF